MDVKMTSPQYSPPSIAKICPAIGIPATPNTQRTATFAPVGPLNSSAAGNQRPSVKARHMATVKTIVLNRPIRSAT
ncbi:MAG: hypothetical protein LQ347_001831 [Umbilicaria vellea]|nr:MAG: hypothetical protein LQ347_001831 [Umbilicaria vellea]